MSNTSQWNVSAASNNQAPPDGSPEGQAPSTVNDCMREIMAALARWYSDMDGSLVEAGSGNAYSVTTNNSHAALADIPLLVFRTPRSNTGAATLAVDGLAAKAIQSSGIAILADEIIADTVVTVAYNATDDVFDLMNPALAALGTFGALAYLSTVNNAQWSGTDLAITNGGTGQSSAAAAVTALGATPLTLLGVDYTGLTSVEGNALEAGDDFLVMDDTTIKRIPYSDGGMPVQTVSATSDTTDVDDINKFTQYTNAAGCTITLNNTIGKVGNVLLIQQKGAGAVDFSGTATIHSSDSEVETRAVDSVIALVCTVQTGSDGEWELFGDKA